MSRASEAGRQAAQRAAQKQAGEQAATPERLDAFFARHSPRPAGPAGTSAGGQAGAPSRATSNGGASPSPTRPAGPASLSSPLSPGVRGADRVGAAQVGGLAGQAADGIFRSSAGWSLTSRAMRVWRAMSDERVRTHVRGVSLTQRRVSRCLTFYADSSVWVQELSMRRYELLQEWNLLCEELDPELVVDDITFKLSKGARSAGHDGSLANYGVQAVRTRARLTPDELEQVRSRVAAITDKRVRRSVQNAMVAMLEWKKSNPD